MADALNIALFFGKHGEKKAEKSRKVAQSLPGDDSTNTSVADVLSHLYFFVVGAATISMRPKFTSSLE